MRFAALVLVAASMLLRDQCVGAGYAFPRNPPLDGFGSGCMAFDESLLFTDEGNFTCGSARYGDGWRNSARKALFTASG